MHFHSVHASRAINQMFPTERIMISCFTQLIMLNEANNRGTEEGTKRFRGATESCGHNTGADREFKARNERIDRTCVISRTRTSEILMCPGGNRQLWWIRGCNREPRNPHILAKFVTHISAEYIGLRGKQCPFRLCVIVDKKRTRETSRASYLSYWRRIARSTDKYHDIAEIARLDFNS